MIHGERSTYAYRGCRCEPCTVANREYKRGHRLWRTGGKPEVAAVKDTFPAEDCGICHSPLADHRPYFRHFADQVGEPG